MGEVTDTEVTATDFRTDWSSTQTARTPTASQFPALPRLPLRRPRRRGLLTPSTAMADTALALSLMPDSDTAPDITLPTLGPLPPSLPQLRPKPRKPPQRRRRRGPLMPTTATEPDTVLATVTVATPMAAFMADMDSQSLPLPLPRKRRLRRRRRGPLMPTTATEPDTASATGVTDTASPMPDMGMVESDLTTLPQSSPLPRRRRLPPRNKQTAIKSNESRWTAPQKICL